MSKKVVINICHGGFSISVQAMKELIKQRSSWIDEYDLEDYYNRKSNKIDKSWQDCMNEDIKIVRDILGTEDVGDGFMLACLYNSTLIKDDMVYVLSFVASTSKDFRCDSSLVQLVEKLGDDAGGKWSDLKVIEIPDDIDWHIAEYDGYEYIAEDHRTWRYEKKLEEK